MDRKMRNEGKKARREPGNQRLKTLRWLAIFSLIILTLSVRAVPFALSDQPYNIDGFPLVRIADDMSTSGSWRVDNTTPDLIYYNSKMPVFPALLGTFSILSGAEPMTLVSYLTPILAVASVVLIYLITLRITENDLAAFAAAAVLALSGFFLYFTLSVMKENVGLVLLPMIIYFYHEREDWRKRMLAAVLLLTLPLTHHLTVFVVFTIIALMAITSNAIFFSRGELKLRNAFLDIALGPALFYPGYLYFRGMGLEHFSSVDSMNDIMLFLSVFTIGAILSIMLCRPVKARPWYVFDPESRAGKLAKIFDEKVVILLVGILIFSLNSRVMLFTGTSKTTSAFMDAAVPYLLLAVVALAGFNLIRYSKTPFQPMLVSVFMAPLIIILFGLLRGLDPFTFQLASRSINYMDFAIAVCAGVAVAYTVNNLSRSRRKAVGTLFAVLFITLLLASTPLAYRGEELYNVQDTTPDYEFSAMRFASSYGADMRIGTDQRINDIMNPYFYADCDRAMPLKLNYGVETYDDLLFLEEKWSATGAQMFPSEPVVIEQDVFNKTMGDNDVIYCGGPDWNNIYIVKIAVKTGD